MFPKILKQGLTSGRVRSKVHRLLKTASPRTDSCINILKHTGKFTGFGCPRCQLLYADFLVLHFELLRLVHFKLWGSWLNTFHVSPSQSVRLQWTAGPSSSALRSAQLCPILHLRSQVIEHYQFWQLPRATGIWVLPPFTHPAPPKHTHTHNHTHLFSTVCLFKGRGLEMKGGTKAVKVKKETEKWGYLQGCLGQWDTLSLVSLLACV